jgi:hypothetical protein
VCPSQQARDDEPFSVADLSPHNIENVRELFVLFKAYFDGGNDPNNSQHRWVTLSAIFSDQYSLREFAASWKAVLVKHSIEYLHTTDAVKNKQHDLLWDCVSAIGDHLPADNTFRGIIPTTVTMDAREFRIVRDEIPNSPQIVSEMLAAQTLDRLIMGGREIARRRGWDDRKVFYSLYFDRGEPYRGHIEDRMRHPDFQRTAIRVNGIDVERYIHIHPPLDSRDFPELQAADLFSWCYNHRHRIYFEWQYKLLDMQSDSVLLDRDTLINPDWKTVNFIDSLNLPKRRR